MYFSLNNQNAFVATGAASFDRAQPTLVFLHGAGMDHSVFAQQTRWFSHRGRNVLAFDFPGHGRSDGAALESIDALADWTAAALDQLSIGAVALVGHSMGAHVALALAARQKTKARALALIGAGLAMGVSADLMADAAENSQSANAKVNLWGFGARASFGGSETPGVWMIGAGDRLLRQAKPGVLHADLAACNNHQKGADYAAMVDCPTLIIQGARDKMTPLKGARALAQAIAGAALHVIDNAGHMAMIENGAEVRAALGKIL